MWLLLACFYVKDCRVLDRKKMKRQRKGHDCNGRIFSAWRSYLQIKYFFLGLIVPRVINGISNRPLLPHQHCLIREQQARGILRALL